MDWPLTCAVGGVAVLAGALGIGAYAVLGSGGTPQANAAATQAQPARNRLTYPSEWKATPYPAATASFGMPAAPVRPAEPVYGMTISNAEEAQRPAPPQASPPARPKPAAATRLAAHTPPDADRPEEAEQRPKPRRSVVARHSPEQSAVERPAPQAREQRTEAPRPFVTPPAAAPTQAAPARQDPRYARVMTAAKVAHLRATLRLTAAQNQHWPPVAASLRQIEQVQLEKIRQGQEPEVASGEMMRLYQAAQPLLGMLQPDQKERVRALARSLGYANLASMI